MIRPSENDWQTDPNVPAWCRARKIVEFFVAYKQRDRWRWLCCRTGHHRETVRETLSFDAPPVHGVVTASPALAVVCKDCGRTRFLCIGTVRTPSRRYALRRQGTV